MHIWDMENAYRTSRKCKILPVAAKISVSKMTYDVLKNTQNNTNMFSTTITEYGQIPVTPELDTRTDATAVR